MRLFFVVSVAVGLHAAGCAQTIQLTEGGAAVSLLETSRPSACTAIGPVTVSVGGSTWSANVRGGKRLLRNTAAKHSATHLILEAPLSTPDGVLVNVGTYSPIFDLRDDESDNRGRAVSKSAGLDFHGREARAAHSEDITERRFKGRCGSNCATLTSLALRCPGSP